MTLLRIAAVGKLFGGLRALDNIHFDVDQGEIVGLMGANGAGKTTLFAIIAGHAKPSEGEVQFDGQSITGFRPDRICRLGIARTFQIVRPFAGLTAVENVETAILFGRTQVDPDRPIRSQAMDILNEVGLVTKADHPAGTLTLSMRKRLEVARALGTQPKLLLLDEVMAGLTPTEVAEMTETIRSVRKSHNLTIIIVEHVVRALVDLSDRLVVLHHGRQIAEGAPEVVAKHPDVLEAYFGRTPS